LLEVAEREQVDLTVVGPELPLSLGVVDAFVLERRLIVGPGQAAARLETSKAFAKDFMWRHGVPTARFHTCETADEARSVVHSSLFGFPVVLKADGLPAGGVVVAATAEEQSGPFFVMVDQRFRTAGARLVIEGYSRTESTYQRWSCGILATGPDGSSMTTWSEHRRNGLAPGHG
jgi:phosphoribosylamine--glycine ligase